MPLPTNVRPNPNQFLANHQWRDVFRSQYITPHQGLYPRSIVGHPASVAKASLFSQDVPYGDDPTRTGAMGTAWFAAQQARATEASQTLALNGLSNVAYGRKSGTLNRSLRVRRMPVGALGDDAAACAAQYPPEVTVPFLAFIAGMAIPGVGADPNIATRLFGKDVSQCLTINLAENVMECWESSKVASPTGTPNNDGFYLCLGEKMGADPVRFAAAAQRMRDMNWWTSNWEFYWKYLSGYTPLYKNPVAYVVGGMGAAVAAGVYTKMKRKR